ncbi:hypothetical protein UlMin_008761 [Ulmus minor]
MLDASAGGALLNKSYAEAYDLIESIATNSYQWPTSRLNSTKKVARVHELNDVSALTAQIASLTNMLKAVSTSNAASLASIGSLVSSVSPVVVEQSNSSVETISCVFCGGGHIYDDCPNNPILVNYVGNYNARNYNSGNYNRGNNPYSNTYNPSWRQHPNFSWSNQVGQGSNNPNRPINPNLNAPPSFQQQQDQRTQFQAHAPPAPQERSNSLESMMKAFMTKTESHIQNQGVALRNLENQVGQLANALSSRQNGALPSNTEVIQLRSGKEITTPGGQDDEQPENRSSDKVSKKETQAGNKEKAQTPIVFPEISSEEARQKPPKLVPEVPPPPFPQRLRKANQDKQFGKFLEILKQLHINIPLVEALQQMPNYVKFMKDVLTNKIKLGEFETVGSTNYLGETILGNRVNFNRFPKGGIDYESQ